jgi:hypothetical protein
MVKASPIRKRKNPQEQTSPQLNIYLPMRFVALMLLLHLIHKLFKGF